MRPDSGRRTVPRPAALSLVLGLILVLAPGGRLSASEDLTGLVARLAPSLISVRATQPSTAVQLENQAFFKEFFGKDSAVPGGRLSTGAGFLVSADGLAVTAAHIVVKAERVSATLADGRDVPAAVVGADPVSDVALIRIPVGDLSFVPLPLTADRPVMAGERVVAFGDPFRLGISLATGHAAGVRDGTVADIDRRGTAGDVSRMLRHTAPTPRGYAGGPLVDGAGQVLGMNSSAILDGTNWGGLAFAVPAAVVARVVGDLTAYGEVRRARLGVLLQDMDTETAAAFGFDAPTGALIAGITDGGPAAKAGLRIGDIVLRANGEPISRVSDLTGQIAQRQPGQMLGLEIVRDGTRDLVAVTLDQAPPPPE